MERFRNPPANRDIGEGLLVDDGSTDLGHLTLRELGLAKQPAHHPEAEHGVTEQLETLIRIEVRAVVQHRSVPQRGSQELPILESVADGSLERIDPVVEVSHPAAPRSE